jgi:hypothetical protein
MIGLDLPKASHSALMAQSKKVRHPDCFEADQNTDRF